MLFYPIMQMFWQVIASA